VGRYGCLIGSVVAPPSPTVGIEVEAPKPDRAVWPFGYGRVDVVPSVGDKALVRPDRPIVPVHAPMALPRHQPHAPVAGLCEPRAETGLHPVALRPDLPVGCPRLPTHRLLQPDQCAAALPIGEAQPHSPCPVLADIVDTEPVVPPLGLPTHQCADERHRQAGSRDGEDGFAALGPVEQALRHLGLPVHRHDTVPCPQTSACAWAVGRHRPHHTGDAAPVHPNPASLHDPDAAP